MKCKVHQHLYAEQGHSFLQEVVEDYSDIPDEVMDFMSLLFIYGKVPYGSTDDPPSFNQWVIDIRWKAVRNSVQC